MYGLIVEEDRVQNFWKLILKDTYDLKLCCEGTKGYPHNIAFQNPKTMFDTQSSTTHLKLVLLDLFLISQFAVELSPVMTDSLVDVPSKQSWQQEDKTGDHVHQYKVVDPVENDCQKNEDAT